MPYDLVSEFGAYVDAGGWVMPPLILGTLVLWFAIGYRFAALKRGSQKDVRNLIRHIGMDSIGDVLALPRAELARRTGPQLLNLLDRLLGRLPDPRPEWRPPRHFSQTIELLGEIAQTMALMFPARRLIVALCGFLRGQGGGAQRLQWTLEGDLDRAREGLQEGVVGQLRGVNVDLREGLDDLRLGQGVELGVDAGGLARLRVFRLALDLFQQPLVQREGRVDRFGQKADKVKAYMLYGRDNPIDGVVLDVILKKVREIRKSIGISMPLPLPRQRSKERWRV